MKLNNIELSDIFVHAPYIINLANNTDSRMRRFTIDFLKQELSRCESLGINKLILHPGSHVGLGINSGLNNIVEALDEVLEDVNVFICLESMSGKGTELGSNFNELKYIIDNCKFNYKLRVCLDTCHLHDSGFDISKFDYILDEFDKLIGIDKLVCIHVNDSKNNINDKKDRHANIGFGNLGFSNIINIIYNKRLENVVKILETPYVLSTNNSYPPYKFEIEMIKNKVFDGNLLENVINYYEKEK